MSFSDWGAFREMDALPIDGNDFLGNFPLSIINRYATPRTDVYQTDREIIVKSEVPGLAREDMEVLIEDTYIRLSGQKRRMKTRDNEEIYRSEQFYGSFSRIIPLPAEVQPDMAVAEYRDGVLSVVIPKSDNKSPRGKKVVIT
jgi:HSP20 family protein